MHFTVVYAYNLFLNLDSIAVVTHGFIGEYVYN